MSAPAARRIDRPAAIRTALRALVARSGFHGASMAAVAEEAGVATGTAYVHYASKDELVLAAYLEVKRELGLVAVADVDPAAAPEERFAQMWHAIHRHLAADRARARFLVQVDGSPYRRAAHAQAMAEANDPLMTAAATPDLAARLAPLPAEVLYDVGIGPAVRLAASGESLTPKALTALAGACWRAITRPEGATARRPGDRQSSRRRGTSPRAR